MISKTTRREFLLAIGGAGAIGAGAYAGVVDLKPKPKDTIRVGVLHSLSGTMSIVESPLRDAALLAVHEINQAGGVLGRPIEAIVENGASDTHRFQNRAEKLLVEDKVCTIFGCCTSSSRKAILPAWQKHKSLLWYPVTYEGNECTNNVIYSGSTPNQQMLPALKWLAANSYHSIYLLGSDYVYPRTANKIVQHYASDSKLKVVGETYVPYGHREFDETIKQIRAAKPDIVLSTVVGDSNRSFYHALSEAGMTPKDMQVMAFSIAESAVRAVGPSYMTDYLAAWSYFQTIETAQNKSFVKSFKHRYGDRRVTDDLIEAAYFEVYLWAQAVAKAGTTKASTVASAAAGQSLIAPQGRITIDPDNHHVWKNFRVGQIQSDGQFKIIYTADAPIAPDPWDETLNNGAVCDYSSATID
jgi:urea transport system substrate-binding protein